eukprot:2998922-Amphidinium_carterae.1
MFDLLHVLHMCCHEVLGYCALQEPVQLHYTPPASTFSCKGVVKATMIIFTASVLAAASVTVLHMRWRSRPRVGLHALEVGASTTFAVAAVLMFLAGAEDNEQTHPLAAASCLACALCALLAGALLWPVNGAIAVACVRKQR